MSARRRSLPVKVARTALWVLAVAHVVEAALLRYQRRQVPLLGSPAGPRATGGVSGERPEGRAGHAAGLLPPGKATVEMMATGEGPDEATLDHAVELMASTGVEVVDLVPAGLPPDRLLRVLRRLDVGRLAGDVLYAPGGAHDAIVLSHEVAKRMPVTGGCGLDRGELVRATVEAQRCAPTASTVRVAPGLRASPWTARDRWRELQELCAYARPAIDLAPLLVGIETLHLLAMSAGLLIAPGPATVALATWSAQPALALGRRASDPDGAPATSVGLAGMSVTRLLWRWVENVRTWAAYPDARRPTHPDPPPPPSLEARFEDRTRRCPWCGSGSLVGRVDGLDLNQFKPGVFHLDECTDCGHLFQNPRLSPTGLAYHYADVYDRYGEEMLEYGLSTRGKNRLYQGRVDAVAAVAEPTSWLDVGTGHGHFCLVARQRWPHVRFDGLDQSDSVLHAERRGRIDTAHLGQFPDLATELAGSYDVISMNHYLEHAREPRREIAAAGDVLRPGGHLLIEVPDAASPWAKLLGRYWVCWLQPQHLHFFPCENLVAELGHAGFEVLSVQRADAGEGFELTMATLLLMQHLAGPGQVPWLPAPSLLRQLRRVSGLAVSVPLVAGAALVDALKDPWLSRPGSTTPGTGYRIVARKR